MVKLIEAGDPVEIAQRYNEEGTDENTFLDITATHQKEKQLLILSKRLQKRFLFH